MSEQDLLYTDTKRKGELVEMLSRILEDQFEAADVLDSKAIELLKISSATFGVVSALEISLSRGDVGLEFWLVLGIVMIVYGIQVCLVVAATRPMKWRSVPGVAGERLTYETMLPVYMAEYDPVQGKYVFLEESRFLDQLLTDYLGRENPAKPNEIQIGAIALAQNNNKNKSRLITTASALLGVIVIGLVIMAIVAVGIPTPPTP